MIPATLTASEASGNLQPFKLEKFSASKVINSDFIRNLIITGHTFRFSTWLIDFGIKVFKSLGQHFQVILYLSQVLSIICKCYVYRLVRSFFRCVYILYIYARQLHLIESQGNFWNRLRFVIKCLMLFEEISEKFREN